MEIAGEIQEIIYSFITAFGVTFLGIPTIITVARMKHLFDEPNDRTSHTVSIPTLGGLAIFAGVIFTITFWTKFSECWHLQYLISAMTVISFIGIKDDIVGLSPFKKAMGQLLASMIIVIWGGVRITTFHNIFGIVEIPEIFSILFTVFTIFIIINAFNLIDGINGLAGTLGIIASLTFAIWFCLIEDYQHAIVAFSLVGSLVAFLRYNFSPAKIFMGDTGSMLLGLILSYLAIVFIENDTIDKGAYFINSAPIVAISIIFLPLFDTLRVMLIRLFNKRSPFSADRNHLHHRLLDLGLSHTLATVVLAFFSVVIIIIALIFQDLFNYWLGLIIILFGSAFSYTLALMLKRKNKIQ